MHSTGERVAVKEPPGGSRLLQAEGGRSWMVERRYAVQRVGKDRELR